MARILAVVALAAVLAGCGGAQPTPQVVYVTPEPTAAPTAPELHTISASVEVPGYVGLGQSTKRCENARGYTDVVDGANVVVYDGAGGVVGTAPLALYSGTIAQCFYRFRVTVPRADFYRVQIAGRDGPTRSYADMDAAAWSWRLSLGS